VAPGSFGAPHLNRRLPADRHDVKLMPARTVKPCLKGHTNDFRDAEANAEAALSPGRRPTMRFVATKTTEVIGTSAALVDEVIRGNGHQPSLHGSAMACQADVHRVPTGTFPSGLFLGTTI
jgi:hypothetical protein